MWRTLVLARVGDGSTRRRASDAVRVGVAGVVVGLTVAVIDAGGTTELDIASTLTSVPTGLQWLTTALWFLGSIGVIVLLAGVAVASRRPRLARDAAVAGFGVWLLGLGLEVWLGPTGGRPAPSSPSSSSLDFPLIQLAAAMAVAVVVMPYLSRPARHLFAALVGLGALAGVLRGSGLPLPVVATLVLGWGFGTGVHLVFGSPSGLPAPTDVERATADLGFPVSAV